MRRVGLGGCLGSELRLAGLAGVRCFATSWGRADGGHSQATAARPRARSHLTCAPTRPPRPPRPGSYRYMAPEVFRHEPYNSRVDVYSFSMIVYQLFEVGRALAGWARRCCLWKRAGGRGRSDVQLLLHGRPRAARGAAGAGGRHGRAQCDACAGAGPVGAAAPAPAANRLPALMHPYPPPAAVPAALCWRGLGGGACARPQ